MSLFLSLSVLYVCLSLSLCLFSLSLCCPLPLSLSTKTHIVVFQYCTLYQIEEALVRCSSKLVLVDKLLPKLKEGGHKVLIFSQYVIVLNVLEDYLNMRQYQFERIDGSSRGK